MSTADVLTASIEFDRANITYKPGELLSGKLIVKLQRPMKIKGIRMTIVGRALVLYHNNNREEYFSSEFYVAESDSGRVIELPTAQSSFPFRFQIPSELPSSFEHKRNGNIKYLVKAVLEGPRDINFITKNTTFLIVTDYNLNEKPQASLPIREEIDKSFCCFCICPVGKVHMTISVPSSGFVPGQMIPVTVRCENESSAAVSKIKVYLQRKLEFHVMNPERDSLEREDIMAEEKCENPFTTSFEDHVTVQLKVPPLPPSGLEYCEIIDLDYTLKVVVCFSGMHCRVKRTFPILIGTVPLRSSVQSCNRNATMPRANAPLLEQPPVLEEPSRGRYMPQSGDMPQPSYQGDCRDLNDRAPPSYEKTMRGVSEYDQGPGTSFARQRPGHNYGSVNTVPNPNAPPDEMIHQMIDQMIHHLINSD